MTEPLLINGKPRDTSSSRRIIEHSSQNRRGVDRSSSLSPLSSDHSGDRKMYATKSTEKSDTFPQCTCCPFGKHQKEGDGYYKLRPTLIDRGRHQSSLSDKSNNGNLSPEHVNGGGKLGPLSSNHSSYCLVDSQHEGSSPLRSPVSLSGFSETDMLSRSRNLVTKTTRTVTSSNILPATGENESLTISPEAIKQIKQHTEDSNRLIRELQEQLTLIPQMQERIKSLKEDKRILAHQLQNKSGISSMRSVGVGDYDIDEDHIRIERIKQTVTQQAPKPPARSVGVGVYDVNAQLYTQADVLHTVAEHIQKVREKEIQSWIQEAEAAYEARKASTRSFGVGEKDIWDEENRLIKEREMRTIVIGQQDKPSQRNVGLQVKPSMRDVCIEFSHQETKPATRSCGSNVDLGDIIQEMSAQSVETSSLTPQQQQQNSWTVQKHVIQRKFMEAMTTGRQEDLVNFITGLLKRSVRSVGCTAKPTTADCGMTTHTSCCDRGVGDDVTDVIVKPFVHTKDSFTLAKPSTRTQPTWTDLILTCDAGTNTQKAAVGKSVSTSPPPDQHSSSQSETTNTTVITRHTPPTVASNTDTHVSQTYHRPPSQERNYLLKPHGDMNKSITETTVTEHRTTSTRPEIERKYHSHVDKLMSPSPQPIELDITLPQEITTDERTVTEESMYRSMTDSVDEQHRSEMHMILPGKPDPLTPLTVQMLPNTSQGTEITSSSHTLLSASSADVVDTGLSPKQSSTPPPRSPVQRAPIERKVPMTSHRSRSLSGDRVRCSVSPGIATLSPSSSTTKTVISEKRPYTTLKETTELTESGNTVKKETLIERTFSSSGRSSNKDRISSSSLSDFDYFGTNYSGSKPRGHADRMEGYGDSMTYSSTGADVNDERNKTELHGNPLKSRYTIEEMSGGSAITPNLHTSKTVRSESSSTKSLLRDKDSPRGRKVGVKFADQSAQKSEFNEEFISACAILQQYLQDKRSVKSSKESAAEGVVEAQWFEIASSRTSDADRVTSTCKFISQQFSSLLLEYIINMVDGNGNTALHYAVSNTKFDVMKSLLQTGMANVDLQNKAGYTPVMLASLCEVNSESDRKALSLLLLNADVNITALQAGQTALMLAVSHGRLGMVRLLLEAKSDVNLQDFDGSTALMGATEHNHVDIVKALLETPSIDALLKDNDGSTALDIALEQGLEEIADILDKCENEARVRHAAERRSASRVIPSSHRGGNKSQRASSYSSSGSYTSKFV